MTKKSTDKKMVARNKILSMPRFVLNTLPAPPNTVPKPVPFCCNKMAAVSVIPTTTCRTVRRSFIETVFSIAGAVGRVKRTWYTIA